MGWGFASRVGTLRARGFGKEDNMRKWWEAFVDVVLIIFVVGMVIAMVSFIAAVR